MKLLIAIKHWILGRRRPTRPPACPACDGRGKFLVRNVPCWDGQTHDVECSCRGCGGTGSVPRKILVPAGSDKGAALHLVRCYGESFGLN